MEKNEQNATETTTAKQGLDDTKNLYKRDFKEILAVSFKKPTDGVYFILKNPSDKSHIHSLILLGSVFVLYFIGVYIIAGEYREYLELSQVMKICSSPLICMLMISVLSFIIKSVSGNPVFKNELLTGALCGIPFGLLIPIVLVIKLFLSERHVMDLLQNPTGSGAIVSFSLLLLYLILMLISIFQQSLRSSGTKDAIAWYLSPISILLTLYLTSLILY